MLQQWRWGVFSGEIPPGEYNAAWWRLREEYAGISPPLVRSEEDFDAAAKWHLAANIPYIRYYFVLMD